MRYFLGVHKFAPIPALLGEMGWFKHDIGRNICALRYWNRLINMDDSRLPKVCFNEQIKTCNKNWAARLELLFVQLGMEDTFSNKNIVDLRFVRDQLENNSTNNWFASASKKPKLKSYVNFKNVFQTEDYGKHCKSRYRRSIFAQFRCGILPIKLKTGRYTNLPIEERLCEICNTDAIESEMHFLLDCELYTVERNNLISNVTNKYVYFSNLDKHEQFNYLVSCEWKLTSLYVKAAWKKRQLFMYK